MIPLFISYYTPRYADEVNKLIGSLRRFELNHEVKPIAELGSWQENTRYKATFIRALMNKHPKHSIVFLDADAIVRQHPGLLYSLDESVDLACHFRNWRLNKHELLSGTLYLANNIRTIDLVDEWIRENDKNKNTWEQKNLQAVVERRGDIKIAELPFSYCRIFDDKNSKEAPVIEHFQASRRLRR